MLNIQHIRPLSTALNIAGNCQEIDFKRFDYLECSIRHTNHSSIFGRTSTGIIQRLYSTRHAVNQVWRGRACHTSMTACRNSARLVGWLALASMVRVTSYHMFSICTPYGSFSAPCLDSRYNAIFIIRVQVAVCGPGYDHLSGKAGIWIHRWRWHAANDLVASGDGFKAKSIRACRCLCNNKGFFRCLLAK